MAQPPGVGWRRMRLWSSMAQLPSVGWSRVRLWSSMAQPPGVGWRRVRLWSSMAIFSVDLKPCKVPRVLHPRRLTCFTFFKKADALQKVERPAEG